MQLPLSVFFDGIKNPSSIDPKCILIYLRVENESQYNDRQFIFNGAYVVRKGQKIRPINLGYFDTANNTTRVSSCVVLNCGLVEFPATTLKGIELGDRIITHITDYSTGEGIHSELVCTSIEPLEFGRKLQRRDQRANELVDFDRDYKPLDIQSNQIVEITDLVERLELVEEKLGIRFDGMCARARKRIENSPPDYVVEVNFDVVGIEPQLKQSFHPVLSAYNSNGQLINTCDTFIRDDKFIGIASCKLILECHQEPIRLRLYPKPF